MTISWIEDHEIEEAERIVKEKINFELPRLLGTNILVKLTIREEEIITVTREDGSKVSLILPEEIRAHERFQQVCALVVDMGEGARRENPNYRIGDFILIPRQEGIQLNFRKYTQVNVFHNVFHIIEHDKEYGVVRSPMSIERLK
ncbi:MAG TPA: hypothetical protein VHA52_10020 [Candidatus Babeliaceae bacterium]|nr:hypothetical protein [Candidatus Babeliaceae bacterium]